MTLLVRCNSCGYIQDQRFSLDHGGKCQVSQYLKVMLRNYTKPKTIFKLIFARYSKKAWEAFYTIKMNMNIHKTACELR